MSRSRYYTGGRKRELPPPTSPHDARSELEAALREYDDVALWRPALVYRTRLDYAGDDWRAELDARTSHHRGRRRTARRRIEEPLSLEKFLKRKIARGEIRMGHSTLRWVMPNRDIRRYHLRDGVMTGSFDLLPAYDQWVQKLLRGLPSREPVTIPTAVP